MKLVLIFAHVILISSLHGCTQMKRQVIEIEKFEDTEKQLKTITVAEKGDLIITGQLTSSTNVGVDESDGMTFAMKRDANNKEWIYSDVGRGTVLFVKELYGHLFTAIASKDERLSVKSTTIFWSQNNGVSWTKFADFPMEAKDIVYGPIGQAIVIGYNFDRSWSCFAKKDDKAEWVEVTREKELDQLFLFSNFDAGKHQLFAFNRNGLTLYEIDSSFLINKCFYQLDSNNFFFVNGVCKIDNDMLFAGRYFNTDKISLWRFDTKAKTISRIFEKEVEYFPESIHYFEGIVSMMTSKVLGITTKKIIYTSADEGRSWNKNGIEAGILFSPYTFYKNKFFGYTAVGEILEIDLADTLPKRGF